jgi:integrase
MHPSLHAYLMTLNAVDDESAFLFPTMARRKLPGYNGLSKRFQTIMDKSGVSAPLAREKKSSAEGKGRSAGRSVRALTYHSLRHTLTSLMHNAGVSQELRMQVTGHATEDAHQNYTHTELDTLRAALASVPSL